MTRTLPRLLTARDVSDQTGLSLQRVYELAREGHLPCVRMGRAMRFYPPAVRGWLSEGGTGEWTPPSLEAA